MSLIQRGGGTPDSPPTVYRPEPSAAGMIEQRDVMVPMRDGVHLCVDIYRPDIPDKVVPGEICEYAIEVMATANLFRKGHRICLEITSMDLATGVSGATNVEYIPYHVCSSKLTFHKVYRDAAHPSHLLLPVIPVA